MLDLLTDSYAIVSTATLGYMLWSKRLVRNKDKAILPGKKLKKIDAPPFDFVKDWEDKWLEANGVKFENHNQIERNPYSSYRFWECTCGKVGYTNYSYDHDSSFHAHKAKAEKPMKDLLDFDNLILKKEKEKEKEQEQKALDAKPWLVSERDMIPALENKARTEDSDIFEATLNIITGATFHTERPTVRYNR